MNRTICLLMIGMLLLTTASAYYAGETIVEENPLNVSSLSYTIIENTTLIEGLSVEINSTTIVVVLPSDMPPCSFKIVFIEDITKEVVKEIYVGGGGGSSKTKIVNQTIEVPKYITHYEYLNESDCGEPSERIVEIPVEKKMDYTLLGFIIAALLSVLLLIILVLMASSQKRKESLKGGLPKDEKTTFNG